jgi:hypothetical protein
LLPLAGRLTSLTGAAVVGGVALAAYLATLAPDLLPGDNGELEFAAPTLGIVHPTGYPLYLLTARGLALLPGGGFAARVNLASALWGALAVAVIYALTFRVLAAGRARSPWLPRAASAFVGALAFALAPAFWSQAVVAEVYTLHALFLALALWLWLAPPGPWRSPRRRALLALTLGLGLAHHRSLVLLLPALAVDWALDRRAGRRRGAGPAVTPVGREPSADSGSGLSALPGRIGGPAINPAFAPIVRSPDQPISATSPGGIGSGIPLNPLPEPADSSPQPAAHPSPAPGPGASAPAPGIGASAARYRTGGWLLPLILLTAPLLLYLYLPLRLPAADYLRIDLGGGGRASAYASDVGGVIDLLSGRGFGNMLGLAPADLPGRLGLYGGLVWENFGPVGVALAAVGMVALARRSVDLWRNLALVYLLNVGFGLAYTIGDVAVYFIPAHFVFAIWLAAGVAVVTRPLLRWGLGDKGTRGQGDGPIPNSWSLYMEGNLGRAFFLPGLLVAVSPFLLVAALFATTPGRFDRPEAAQARATRVRWEALARRLEGERAFLVSDDRDELVPLYYLQRIEGRLRDVQPLFPNQASGPAFANTVTLLEAITADRPLYLAKPMPGLEAKLRIEPGEPPRVLGSSVAAAPAFRLSADFGGRLALEGVDLPNAGAHDGRALVYAAPGTTIEPVLHWRVAAPADRPYATFLQAVAPDGAGLAGSDRRPGGAFYPPRLWRRGEALADPHRLALPTAAAPGLYELRAGAYDAGDSRRLPAAAGGDSALAGWLVVPPPPAAAPPRALEVRFGPAIVLQGIGLAASFARDGASAAPLAVTLYWSADRPPERAYTLFLHLVDAGGRLVAQQDGEPLAGRYPTWAWQVGATFVDPHTLALGPLAPGTYRLVAGLYEPASGARLTLGDGADLVTLATMEVP